MCLRILAGIFFGLAVIVVVVSLRLMSGPVSLDFLKARLAQAVDVPGNNIRPEADHISIEWGGISHPIRLVFTGLRFMDAEGQKIADAPSAALTFDPRSVFQGKFFPTSVVVERPTIEVDIAREGGMLRRIFASSEAGSQSEVVGILVDQLLAETNYDSLLGQLDSVVVEHANVTVRDVQTGTIWVAPAANATLKRDSGGVAISANARFAGAGDPVAVSLSGIYARDRSRVSLEAKVEGLKPMVFSALSPDLAVLRGMDIALSGRLRIEATGQGEIRTVAVDITGGNGRVTLPGILPAAHDVRSINAQFSLDAASHTAKIDRIDADFGAARIQVSGTGTRTPEGHVFAGRADVRQIPVDQLGDYWPFMLAAGGREWALANLSKGAIDVAAEFALSAPAGDMSSIKLEQMVGFLGYSGMTVRYMPQMPELQNVSGAARYEGGSLHFDIASGEGAGLRVAGATVDLTGLDQPTVQYARIRMPISGSAQDIVRFLARPKLGLRKEMLYDPARVAGDVAVELSLSFPLISALTVAELEIKADAALTGFGLKDALGELDLTDATARIQYVGSELNVAGQGKLAGHVVDISWRELFGAKAAFRRRYELKGSVPAALVAKAGFPPLEPYVTGPIGTALHYQVANNGTGEVVGRFDLKGAKLDVPQLVWTKEAGADGIMQLSLRLAAGGKLATADVDFRGTGLTAKGQARFAGDNALQQVSVSQLRIGQTDVALEWKSGPGGAEVAVRGPSLELQRVRDMLKSRDEAAAREPRGAAGAARTSTKLSVQLLNVIVKRGSLGYLNGRVELVGDRISSADLSIGGGKGSTFRVTPGRPGRTLFFYVADFGQLLREAGWLDGLVGGYLHIEGKFNDVWADPPLEGTLKMGPFRLQKTTPRAAVGTLNSAIDGLNRAGNALQQFDSLEANLSKAGDRIQVRNGRTSGQSIGLTTQGTVDLGNDTAQLYGVVVPAFALNNLLSNVPLLGPLLTGGKDGGLFAISYQLHGPFDDLRTDVNMMSAVTPGALRDLFNAPPTAPPVAPSR